MTEEQAKQEVETTPFAASVLSHWQEFRPKMCEGLKRQNQLYQSVWAAATRTIDLLQELQHGPAKLPFDRAQEIAYREWYLLPDEEEQPSLTFDPARLQPVSLETSS